MQHLTIIHDFTTLLHRHGPDSDEVEEFILQYDHIEGFVGRAKTLQAVFREKDNVTQAQS
jgi:hypothetical protein